MEDVVPGLVSAITEDFRNAYDRSTKIQRLLERVKSGQATYAEANEYALEVSRLIGKAYEKNISYATLPDGKMYYNISQRLIPAALDENYALVSAYTKMVQWQLNKDANLGINAIVPDIDQDRVNGLVELVSQAKQYDDISKQLLSSFENFSLHIVDLFVEENAKFHYQSGLSPKIIRKAEAKCCKWCRELEGEYEYPDKVPKDVYKRHTNCRCTIEYVPADGKRQNVHTKRLLEDGEHDKIENRRHLGLDNIDTFRPDEQDDLISRYVKLDRASVVRAARLDEPHSHGGVYMDAIGKNKKQLQRSIISRVSQVERHAEKIAHPELYIKDWASKDPRYQAGLLKKWEKDMKRNAEQAEIELAVWKERF